MPGAHWPRILAFVMAPRAHAGRDRAGNLRLWLSRPCAIGCRLLLLLLLLLLRRLVDERSRP
eukprot:COSAG02_NODE_25132_length_668_cov_0.908612_1_plen_61_part_01